MLYKNIMDTPFLLDGEKVSISEGVFMTENLQGGLSSSNIQYFGNDVIGDFDTDGNQDVAFIVTRETSGRSRRALARRAATGSASRATMAATSRRTGSSQQARAWARLRRPCATR